MNDAARAVCKGYYVGLNLLSSQFQASILDRGTCSTACLQVLEFRREGLNRRKDTLRWREEGGAPLTHAYTVDFATITVWLPSCLSSKDCPRRVTCHLLCRTFFYIKPEGTAVTNRSYMLCFWDKNPALWMPEVRCPQGGPWQLMFGFSYYLKSVLLERDEVELEWSAVSTSLDIVE